jgi:hypothetical protein
MRMFRPLVIAVLFMLAGLAHAAAQTVDIEGMPILLGDSFDKVRDFYQTPQTPRPAEDYLHPGATELQLKLRGVSFSFETDGRTYHILLEAPFRGAINGVRIGDRPARMREVLGEPIKTLKPPLTFRYPHYLYYLDDVTTARFGTDGDDRIESVLLFK